MMVQMEDISAHRSILSAPLTAPRAKYGNISCTPYLPTDECLCKLTLNEITQGKIKSFKVPACEEKASLQRRSISLWFHTETCEHVHLRGQGFPAVSSDAAVLSLTTPTRIALPVANFLAHS